MAKASSNKILENDVMKQIQRNYDFKITRYLERIRLEYIIALPVLWLPSSGVQALMWPQQSER